LFLSRSVSDEAISAEDKDCFAALAMTTSFETFQSILGKPCERPLLTRLPIETTAPTNAQKREWDDYKLANAIAHRDYSSYVRGSYIQIRMFADRLEVQSPGGLFGNVTVENLEEEHSTRNVRLMRMMEDLHIVENRGSGIKVMLQEMRTANLEPPRFNDRRSSFLLTFLNHTMMNPRAIAWLNQFASLPLNDRQRLTLVYLRQHEQMTNSEYRRLNRVDTLVAGQELRGLVEVDLVEQQGVGRWTSYQLKVSSEQPEERKPQTDEDQVIAYVQAHSSITNAECRTLLAIEEHKAYYLLKKLCDNGRLRPVGVGKGRRYILR
jgi:predicted HTH transcriptional regulator